MFPTQKPCLRLTQPKFFGRRPDVLAIDDDTPEGRAANAAALFHHRASLTVLDALTDRGQPLQWLADALDIHVDQLRRKLYGQANASLRDIAHWGVAMGLADEFPFTVLLTEEAGHAC